MKIIIALAVLAAGCAHGGYVTSKEQGEKFVADDADCRAKLTDAIWAGKKPLLTSRFVSRCLEEKGWHYQAGGFVMP